MARKPRKVAEPAPLPKGTLSADGYSYTSPKGRVFTLGPIEHEERWKGDPLWSDTINVLLDGAPAGKLFQSESYGKTANDEPRWHASLNGLRMKLLKWGESTPYGIGFDVAAFDTMEECLAAWSRNADGLLDWREANPAV